MKLKIEFSKNTEPVPFTYVSNLNGYLHKILGNDNHYHDDISLYSTSFLHGGKMNSDKKSLNFYRGATWFVSSPNKEFIMDFITNIYNHPEFAFGMELQGVEIVKGEIVEEGGYYTIQTKSPVLLKQRDFETRKNIYYTYEDEINTTSELMKHIILKKAEKANVSIGENDFELFFDHNYPKKKTRWITVKSVNNKTSVCPVVIKTNKKEVADFIYDVGVGHSTGSGFGFLL